MKQERINYSEIVNLNFKEEYSSDKVYFDMYGYDYVIITKDLTNKIYIDWAKETGFCEIVRIDNKKDCNIQNRKPIKNLEHLKEIVNFYTETKKHNYDYTKFA